MGSSNTSTEQSVFDVFAPAVRSALADRGFDEPTEPQRRAIPPLVAGDDGLVIAPTGTGKTETAMLPVFNAISQADQTFGISALYITPLRALNRDMQGRLSWWGDTLDIRVDVRHGDTSQYQRSKQANDPPDVLITTPETVQAILTGEKLRKALADVNHVVIDEVHELASSKRGAQLSIGLERLATLAGSFQRIGLSATVGDPEEVGAFLTAGDQPTFIEIDASARMNLSVERPQITDADHEIAGKLLTDPEIGSHVRRILEIVDEHESTLIFVNTRQTAEAMGSRFNTLDADIGVHHGSLSKTARIEVEDEFKAGSIDALLCTSSMELGIDVGQVDHVVQYGSPREVTRLVQRVGRAGHQADAISHGTIIARSPDDTFESIVIARRASAGLVEPAHIHHGSLDVVANQIVGLVMDTGEISARKAYEIVTRAYPFRDLEEDTFKNVVRELHANRIIWLNEDDDQLEKRDGSWQYYYSKLSMIPDEETYAVTDMASGSQIGTLDERFVINFAEPGASFIQGGEMWRIVNVDEEETSISATPIEDPAGEIPSWIGEEIPVPFDVAQEVGALRMDVADHLTAGEAIEEITSEVCSRYPTSQFTVSESLTLIEDHTSEFEEVPADSNVVIESAGDTIVINTCCGHQVNETLGRLCAALIGQATGASVGMNTDPYRVELTVTPKTTGEDVVDILLDTDPSHVAELLRLSLKRSETLSFKLAQVAEMFGALKRWEGSGSIGSRRLRKALEDTPAFEESIREIFHSDLDVPHTKIVLEKIQRGDWSVQVETDRTPIGTAGDTTGQELLTPENADASVIETVKERLHEDEIQLVCLHCKEWNRVRTVNRISAEPTCPLCDSTRIAAVSPWIDDALSAVKREEKTEDQEKLTRRAYWSANLVQSHGKKAVIALAARGVGPQNAARIINNWREDEDDFYRDILRREREYARTKSFWD